MKGRNPHDVLEICIYQLSCGVETPKPHQRGCGEAVGILDQPWLGAKESFLLPSMQLISAYTVQLVYKGGDFL